MNLRRLVMFIPVLVLAGLSSMSERASAAPLFATGSGWCEATNYCNNTDTNNINNHYAGEGGSDFRNWFAFQLPVGNITAASLYIWNNEQNVAATANTIYNVYAPTAISHTGIRGSGPSLGSVAGLVANIGVSRYVEIVLNSDGIDYLNSKQGSLLLLGGAVTPTSDYAEMFGYTGGTPAAYLEFSSSAVPEPGTLAILGSSLAGLVLIRRKTQN